MLEPEDRAEAARMALELLQPDRDSETVDRRAFSLLAAGDLTGDRAVSLWTEKYRLHLLGLRLRAELG